MSSDEEKNPSVKFLGPNVNFRALSLVNYGDGTGNLIICKDSDIDESSES